MLTARCNCGQQLRADPARPVRHMICRQCGEVVELREEGTSPPTSPRRPTAPPRPSPAKARPAAPRRRMGVRARLARATAVASAAYLGLALVAWVALWALGDRWWLATLLLFSGRWVLLTPLAILLPMALLFHPRWIAALAAAALVVLGPVMGLQLNWRFPGASDSTGPALRVVTLNAAGGAWIAPQLPSLLREWRPDVLALQECGSELREAVSATAGWHSHAHESLCLLSRHPIREAAAMDRSALARIRETSAIGGAGEVIRYTLDTPLGPVHLTNLHLETPRKGIESLAREGAGGMGEMEGNTTLRGIEARMARRWATARPGPAVVVGDFNTPVESRIYRESWGDLQNAFSRAGRGFGMTRYNGWIRVRIDHVLLNDALRVRSVRVGPDVGSDHRPVIAELTRAGR